MNLSIIVWLIIKSTASYLASTYITHLNKVWDNLKPLNKATLEKMPKWFQATKSLKEMEVLEPYAS
jgi:hypothetical protein